MNELDDDIRRAFTAVELDPSVCARLARDPAPAPWPVRLAIAAAALLALGLAAVPAVERGLELLPAGLRATDGRRVELPMDPLDRWIPDGSLVLAWMESPDRSLGIQRLIRAGERMELELVDQPAWTDSPERVRLARIDGPLVEWTASIDQFPHGEPGEVLLAPCDREPVEILARDAQRTLIRNELAPVLSWYADPFGQCLPADTPWVDRSFEVDRRDRIRTSELSAVYAWDARTGAAIGKVQHQGFESHDHWVRWIRLQLPPSAAERELRLLTVDGAHALVYVPAAPGPQIGDPVALFDATEPHVPLVLDATVAAVHPDGLLVRVPRRRVPHAVRARELEVRPWTSAELTRVEFVPQAQDAALLTLQNVEVVGLVDGGARHLGPVRLIGIERPDIGMWQLERPLPAGVRPPAYRLVQRLDGAYLVSLQVEAELDAGPALVLADGRTVAEVEVLRTSRGLTSVRVDPADLDAVLLADREGVAIRAP